MTNVTMKSDSFESESGADGETRRPQVTVPVDGAITTSFVGSTKQHYFFRHRGRPEHRPAAGKPGCDRGGETAKLAAADGQRQCASVPAALARQLRASAQSRFRCCTGPVAPDLF